jgi:eukaryotic-like serine/threonine-protein kinase
MDEGPPSGTRDPRGSAPLTETVAQRSRSVPAAADMRATSDSGSSAAHELSDSETIASVRPKRPRHADSNTPPSSSGSRPGLDIDAGPGSGIGASPGASPGSSQSALTPPSIGSPSRSALRAHTDAAIASAMLEEEGERAHGFSGIIATLTLLVGMIMPVLGGDPVAKLWSLAALATICTSSIAVWYLTRVPKRYTWLVHRSYGMLIGTGVVLVEYYIGFFSPVPVVLTLGIIFLGQSGDRRGSVMISLWIVSCWASLAALQAAGVIPDIGLFPVGEAELSSRIFAVFAVSTVLLLTLRMARVSRQSVRQALRRSHEALMVAHEREAQLEEAHQNLDRALRAAVGKAGRYTGALAGSHRLGVLIGVGAMGEVYSADGAGDEASVAVKLLHAEAIEREDLVERFLREGEICLQLSSPHVVRVLDVGRLENGSPYLTMERLYGEDLAMRLRRDGHLPLDETATLARQMAKGLEQAHGLGIVHRDLKPHNLFHSDDADGIKRWKILDFGVSKLSGSSGTLTERNVVGTPGYMSPEQARGLAVDHRSDLFSMAVVLYRALTGRQPFTGPSVPQILFDIVYHCPERPSSLRPELPEDIELVLAIALSKEPKRRFESATELARAFASAARRDLSGELRRRGEDAVRRYPWNTSLRSPD